MSTPFAIPESRLHELAALALDHARALGASDASAEASESVGLSVSTRKMQPETIEHTRDKGLAVSVYLGQRRGHASTSDFSEGMPTRWSASRAISTCFTPGRCPPRRPSNWRSAPSARPST